jgi:galactonate dehydratase
VFVKVTTDEPGLHGWGEASLEWKTRAAVGAVEDFADIVVGENPVTVPLDPELVSGRGDG